jgi:hypothetical protein
MLRLLYSTCKNLLQTINNKLRSSKVFERVEMGFPATTTKRRTRDRHFGSRSVGENRPLFIRCVTASRALLRAALCQMSLSVSPLFSWGVMSGRVRGTGVLTMRARGRLSHLAYIATFVTDAHRLPTSAAPGGSRRRTLLVPRGNDGSQDCRRDAALRPGSAR